MMRNFFAVFAALTLGPIGFATAGEMLVGPDRIKVFLFAAPAFYSEVGVDVRNSTCLSLDNNLIDGRVRSVLIGGSDVWAVRARKDNWYCVLWDNHECQGGDAQKIVVSGGQNNLESAGWGSRVRGVQCVNPKG
ncbi:hypothetical protein CC80DRAFT_327984 [Byssothecium circinans]|uniref:Beta/gamma crystallin 'Greek key' domain-containing protein n=1 Tax=Byssothecium circinans TaxID=147558 RepID=A0A6A5T6Q8_9PLEO|nr:hypothetical protein CC80DRAFT_327984 [Byssothecium circinans]